MFYLGLPSDLNFGNTANAVTSLVGDPSVLIGGIVLIVAALLVIFLLKRIIVNSILGLISWLVLTFLFGINLPFIPSLVISIVFGLAGIGVMLVLRFFGLI